jgi:autotransporter-associated beta strand protein
MKMSPPANLAATAVAAALLLSTPAIGQTVWLGTDSNSFNAAANWSSGLPSASVAAEFNASSTSNLSLSVGTAISAQGIIVKNPSGPVSIAPVANQRLTVGTGGIDMSTATQDLTISTDVAAAFNAGQTWTVATGRTLTINRPGASPAVNNGSDKLSITGAGSVSFVGTTWDFATTSNANLEVDGGNLTLSGNLRFGIHGSNAVTGALTIKNGGTLTTGAANFVQLSGAGANTGGSLTLLDGTLTTSRIAKGSGLSSIEIDGGTLKATTSDVVYIPAAHGSVTLGNVGLTFDSNGQVNLRIETPLIDKVGHAGSLTKTGSGLLILTADNTYTGGTTVEAGTLNVRGSVVGNVTVKDGATLQANAENPSLFALAAYGLVTVERGGTLLRSSFKQLDGGLNLQDGSLFTIGLSDTPNPLAVTGGIMSADGAVTVNIGSLGTTATGVYSLINFTGATLGAFDASAFTVGTTPVGFGAAEGYSYTFSINGNSLELAVIPEPATFAWLLGASAFALVWARRRNR